MIKRCEIVRDLALVGAATAAGIGPDVFAAELPSETKKIRISWVRGRLCVAPQYVAANSSRARRVC